MNIQFILLLLKKIHLLSFCIILLNASILADESLCHFDTILNEINTFKTVHGYPPTQKDCFVLLNNFEKKNINHMTFAKIMMEALNQQHPIITTDQLLKIFHAKRGTIRDYEIKYHVVETEYEKNGNVLNTNEYHCVFAAQKNKLLYEKIKQSQGKPQEGEKISYDGEKIFSLRTLSPSTPQLAGISAPDILGVFFHPYMPMACAGLFDTKACHYPQMGRDAVLFLDGLVLNDDNVITSSDGTKITKIPPNVFEKIEEIDGQKCISVSNGNDIWYFDLNRDFSVVCIEHFKSIFSSSENNFALVGKHLSSKVTLNDLRDFGNGLWIPQQLTIDFFNNESQRIRSVKVNVPLIKVNQGIEDSYFNDFFPENILVSDVVNGTVYQWKDKTSINALLKETVKPKSTRLYQRISVMTGLIMIAIAVVFEIRKRILQRRSS